MNTKKVQHIAVDYLLTLLVCNRVDAINSEELLKAGGQKVFLGIVE